jgi:hypothetical protein
MSFPANRIHVHRLSRRIYLEKREPLSLNERGTVDQDSSGDRVVQPEDERQHGALARTAHPDERHAPAGLHQEVKALEHGDVGPRWVPELDALQLDQPLHPLDVLAGVDPDVGLTVQDIEHRGHHLVPFDDVRRHRQCLSHGQRRHYEHHEGLHYRLEGGQLLSHQLRTIPEFHNILIIVYEKSLKSVSSNI